MVTLEPTLSNTRRCSKRKSWWTCADSNRRLLRCERISARTEHDLRLRPSPGRLATCHRAMCAPRPRVGRLPGADHGTAVMGEIYDRQVLTTEDAALYPLSAPVVRP